MKVIERLGASQITHGVGKSATSEGVILRGGSFEVHMTRAELVGLIEMHDQTNPVQAPDGPDTPHLIRIGIAG